MAKWIFKGLAAEFDKLGVNDERRELCFVDDSKGFRNFGWIRLVAAEVGVVCEKKRSLVDLCDVNDFGVVGSTGARMRQMTVTG